MKYWGVLTTNLKSNITYLKEIWFRSLFMVLVIYIFINLWQAAYGDNERINGLSFDQVMWYLVITETIVLSKSRIAQEIANEVRDGLIVYSLGKPIHYVQYHIAKGLGDSLLKLMINFVAGSLLLLIVNGLFPPIGASIGLVCVVTVLSLILDFIIGAIIGLFAFTLEDISGLVMIYQKLLFIVGGMLIPLDFYPDMLKNFFEILPFNLIVYAPAKLFVDFKFTYFMEVFIQQVIWIAGFSLVAYFMYRRGIRKLTINGG